MVKSMFVVIIFGSGFVVGTFSNWFFGLSWWCISLLTSVTILIVNTIMERSLPYLPLFMQRPFYRDWKELILRKSHSVSDLIGWPMIAAIELELDQEFEKGGLRQACQFIEIRLNHVCNENIEMLDKLEEERLTTMKGK